LHFWLGLSNFNASAILWTTAMGEITIDKNVFQERLSHLISAWKQDKRSGNTLFGDASSILILMGKTEENSQFQKNNAIHVCHSNLKLRSHRLLTA
jgi:hypothetical protein